MSRTVEIEVEVIAMTALAVKVSNGHVEAWLPLSAVECEHELEEGLETTIEVPEKLATDKGLV